MNMKGEAKRSPGWFREVGIPSRDSEGELYHPSAHKGILQGDLRLECAPEGRGRFPCCSAREHPQTLVRYSWQK